MPSNEIYKPLTFYNGSLICPYQDPIRPTHFPDGFSPNGSSQHSPDEHSSGSSQSSLPSSDEIDSPPLSLDMTNQIPATNLDYKFEMNRLKSFEHNWPHGNFLEPRKMAEAGLFFLGELDLCRCPFCNVKIGHWEEGDDPMREHKRWSDFCPYIRHQPCGNVPINLTNPPLSVSLSQPERGFDECGLYNMRVQPVEIRPHTVPENGECTNLEELGIHQARGPSFPNMGSFNSRLDSFKCWPKSMKQRPEELSEAGFFYTGKGDQTICFHCGGGLKDWEESDEPWTEHAKWFNKCAFLILVKGKPFIDRVLEMKSSNQSEEEQRSDIPPTESKEPPTEVEKQDEPPTPSTSSNTNTSLDDPRLCKICYMEEAGVVFLPCGHFVACVKCAPSLSTCAICRKPFTATVRAFLS